MPCINREIPLYLAVPVPTLWLGSNLCSREYLTSTKRLRAFIISFNIDLKTTTANKGGLPLPNMSSPSDSTRSESSATTWSTADADLTHHLPSNGTGQNSHQKASTTKPSVIELSDSGVFVTSPSETSSKILETIFGYALNKFSDTTQRLEAGRQNFLSTIDRFVAADARVEMCLPAFPFKSANKVYKVLGSLPDKAEEIALERLNTMCQRIGEIYAPGARCIIISDGVVYNGRLMDQLHA